MFLGGRQNRRRTQASHTGWWSAISLAWEFLQYRLICRVLSHPFVLRVLAVLLRHVRPIAVLGKTVIVSTHHDVREVLDRFNDFTLAEVLGPKMPWGPHLLTLDWHEQHDRERGLLESVVFKVDDAVAIRTQVAASCRNLIAAVETRGEIDVVSDVCNEVLVRLLSDYFGVPCVGDSQGMTRILGDVSGFILAPPPARSEASARAYANMALLTDKVLERIKAQSRTLRRAPGKPTPADDLLTRLVRLRCARQGPDWFDDDWIRRCVTGLAATGGGTIVRATAHAMDRLVAYPAALREARQLAQEPDGNTDARNRLLNIVHEALRFRPMLPLLSRYSPRETVIAKGTARARMVPAGATVLAPPIAAMFDPAVFKKPARFTSNRPLSDYVHFGWGPRHCFGRYVADIVMVEIIRSLLLLPKLRRASGFRGSIRHDGPVVTSLRLAFNPKSVSRPSAEA
jgi:cytochrome P450